MKIRSSNLNSISYISLPTLSILYTLLCSILTISMQGIYFKPHLTDLKNDHGRLSNSTKVNHDWQTWVSNQVWLTLNPFDYHLKHIQPMQCLALASVTSTLWRTSFHSKVMHIKCICVLDRQATVSCPKLYHNQKLPVLLEFTLTPNDATFIVSFFRKVLYLNYKFKVSRSF